MDRRKFFKNLAAGTAATSIPASVFGKAAEYLSSPEKSWPKDHEFREGDLILLPPGEPPFNYSERLRKKMDMIPVIITKVDGESLTMGPCEDIHPNLFKTRVKFVREHAIYISGDWLMNNRYGRED